MPEATENPAETEKPVATEIPAETEKPQDETSSQVTENPSEEQQIAELFVIEKLFKDRENKNFVADFNSLLPEGKKFAEEQLTNLKETDNLEAFKTLFVSTLQTEGNPADTAFEPLFAMTDENEFKTFLQKLLEENRLLESSDAEIVDGTTNTDNTELIHGNTDAVVVGSMTIRKTGEASDNAAIGAWGDTELMVSVEMSNIQKEAEIAFRFTIPTRSLKDGYLDVVASRYKAIGKRIKIARIKADVAQDDLANRVGISAAHMSNIETGKTHVSLTVIVNIANALATSVDDLLCDNVIKARVQFEKDLAEIIGDCNDYEIRVICDVASATKSSLRRDAHLRDNDTTSKW